MTSIFLDFRNMSFTFFSYASILELRTRLDGDERFYDIKFHFSKLLSRNLTETNCIYSSTMFLQNYCQLSYLELLVFLNNYHQGLLFGNTYICSIYDDLCSLTN